MKSVWVVESGSYSDYCVEGLFSTKEAAEAHKEVLVTYKRAWEVSVNEWSIRDTPAHPVVVYYGAVESGGDAERVTSHTVLTFDDGDDDDVSDQDFAPGVGLAGEVWSMVSRRRTEDEALKAARDRWAEAKAREAGIA